MGSGEKTTFVKIFEEYSDRNLKEKLLYELCESIVTNWREFAAEQKTEKGTLIFLLMLLRIMLMMLLYSAEAYIL